MVVLGWHYTNTLESIKEQVTATLEGEPMSLPATNSALRVGGGDR